MFDHTSHYQYLIDAAWEAVEQHAETSLTPSTSEEGPLDSLASQMVGAGGKDEEGEKSCEGYNMCRLRHWASQMMGAGNEAARGVKRGRKVDVLDSQMVDAGVG